MEIIDQLLKLLEREKFCFLATSYEDHPHVSLMNFTYLQEEKLIILSSRANTTKVKYIKKNPSVALLLYSLGGEGQPPVSCTLYGTAHVVSPDKDRLFRESHYGKHRDMGNFIEGENISVITVRIEHAALSDLDDSVHTWTPGSTVIKNSST